MKIYGKYTCHSLVHPSDHRNPRNRRRWRSVLGSANNLCRCNSTHPYCPRNPLLCRIFSRSRHFEATLNHLNFSMKIGKDSPLSARSINNFHINVEIPWTSEYSRKARRRYRGGIFDITRTRSCGSRVGIVVESLRSGPSRAFRSQLVVRSTFGSIRRFVARVIE